MANKIVSIALAIAFITVTCKKEEITNTDENKIDEKIEFPVTSIIKNFYPETNGNQFVLPYFVFEYPLETPVVNAQDTQIIVHSHVNIQKFGRRSIVSVSWFESQAN